MSVRSNEAAIVALTLEAEPDTATWWVEDGDGETVQAIAAVPGAALDGTTATLTIPAGVNILAAGERQAFRLVRLRYQAAESFAGWREVEVSYLVQAADTELVLQVNSFQGYNQALRVAGEMTGIADFLTASRADRVTAMIAAWRALTAMRYSIEVDSTAQNRIHDFPGANPGDLSLMTDVEFLSLDTRFLEAIRRAQVAEANHRISGGGPNGSRRDGLMSSSIGEVSQMFRPSKPLDLGLSTAAMRELRGYLAIAPRVGR